MPFNVYVPENIYFITMLKSEIDEYDKIYFYWLRFLNLINVFSIVTFFCGYIAFVEIEVKKLGDFKLV